MLQEQDKPASKWRFPSEKLPKPCFGRHNHRRIASKGDVGDWKRATAVDCEAVVGECSRNLVAGLVAKTSRENSSGKPSTREAWSRQSPRLCSTAMSDVRQHADLAPEGARSPHQVWAAGRHCLDSKPPQYLFCLN